MQLPQCVPQKHIRGRRVGQQPRNELAVVCALMPRYDSADQRMFARRVLLNGQGHRCIDDLVPVRHHPLLCLRRPARQAACGSHPGHTA
jgi:hypothetical protein